MKTGLNFSAFALAVIGITFKFNYWPGANIAIILSTVLLVFNLSMFVIKDNKEAGMSTGMNYFLSGALALWIVGLAFKFMHYPGANVLVVLSHLVIVIIPLVLIFQKVDFKISKQFLITFFTYFVLLSGFIMVKNYHVSPPLVPQEMSAESTAPEMNAE